MLQKSRFNVKIVMGAKDVATGRSISKLEKNEKFAELYKLRGNDSIEGIQRYKELMDRYSRKVIGRRIYRNIKEEVKERHLIKQLSSYSPMRAGQVSKYRLSYSPQQYFLGTELR